MFDSRIYIFFFLFCIPLYSQEISEDFLKSLPQSVQDNLKGNLLDQASGDDKSYNLKPDTRLNKLEESISRLKKELVRLEIDLNNERGLGDDDTLNPFGYDFFSSYQSTFAPINNPNPSSDYILDWGDEIKIQFVGKQNEESIIQVNRDGTLNVPSVGKINVAGLSISNAFEIVNQEIKKGIIGVNAFISLHSLRDINILVIGEAENPGFYTLPGGSNILSLINVVGGIKKSGSLRSIIHKRNNNTLQEIDLYEVLIKGNIVFDHQLRNGDVIDVQPINSRVSITGGINKPGIFELKSNETLQDLIEFASGVQANTQEEIKISKSSGKIENVNINKLDDVFLNSGDSVHVFNYYPDNIKTFEVRVTGAIRKPGKYTIEPGTKISELVLRAGGYTENSYPTAGRLFRKSAIEKEKDILEKGYRELINFLAANTSGRSSFTSQSTLNVTLAELRNVEPKGRLQAEFDLQKIKSNASLDIELADGDLIEIPYFTSEVYVLGEVTNPGAKSYKSNASTKDYLKSAGGLGRFADKKRVFLIQPNGNAFLVSSRFAIFSEQHQVLPGSVIYAPRDIGKIEGISYAAVLAPILSSVALSLASLNSISD